MLDENYSQHRDMPPGGWIRYWQRPFPDLNLDELFNQLRAGLAWAERDIVLFGKRIKQPRLVAFHGDPGVRYGYSGQMLMAEPWSSALLAIKEAVEALCHTTFNSALCNLYRHGADSMGWHADNEASLGREPLIASFSLGATRRFSLKPRRSGESLAFDLEHGSLLLMGGDLQTHWLHQLPKTRRPVGPRINLTFRQVKFS